MLIQGVSTFAQVFSDECRPEEEGVVEIPLLLPQWQAEALESLAHDQGQTAGEMIRQLLMQYLRRKTRR